MTYLKLNITGSHCTYPGEYIPAPLTMDEICTALQQSHEGSSVPLMNVVETPDAFTVEVAAPGLKNSDLLVRPISFTTFKIKRSLNCMISVVVISPETGKPVFVTGSPKLVELLCNSRAEARTGIIGEQKGI